MEQGQCWMWTKRKYTESSNIPSPTSCYTSSFDESWKEQAFAKDAAGLDCIWPPRSYSCRFCARELRSAQALGGHMNVHRRDRARLKQLPYIPQDEVLCHDLQSHDCHNPVKNSFTSLDCLSSLSGLPYTTNPNSDSSSHVFSSTSKVIDTEVNKNFKEKSMIPLYDDSSLSSKSLSNLVEDHSGLYSVKFEFDHPNGGGGAEKISKGMDIVQFETKEKGKGFKKRKIDASGVMYLKSNSVGTLDHRQSRMFEFIPGSIEELDLELRLGDKPN